MAKPSPEQLSLLIQQAADKHNLTAAQVVNLADEAQSRGVSRRQALETLKRSRDVEQYSRLVFGEPWDVAKEDIAMRERQATNDRLVQSSERAGNITALGDVLRTTAASMNPEHAKYTKGALDAMFKQLGIPVPADPVDPKKAAQQAAYKDLNPSAPGAQTAPTEPAVSATPTPAAPEPTPSSPFKPMQSVGMSPYFDTQPEEAPAPAEPQSQPQYPAGVKPPLGVGGAQITPDNPTGNPSNPWAPGGLFANNPTHLAAQNVQAREAANFPYGPDSRIGESKTYGVGEAAPFLTPPATTPVSPQPLTSRNAATPSVMQPANVPPQESVSPTPVNNFAPQQGNYLPPSPTPAPAPVAMGPPTSNFNIGSGFAPGAFNPFQWLAQFINQPKRVSTLNY